LQETSVWESVDSLNALDLDVEALEQRLDLVANVHVSNYTCIADEVDHPIAPTACGVNSGQ
jgi:hypothetical protein